MEWLLGSVILVLVLFLIAQQVYWMIFTQKLLNKVMSKNYAEYVQVENTKTKEKTKEEPFEDPYAERQAHDANTMMGMI